MKRILLFGAGKSATVLIDYLINNAAGENWKIVVVDADLQMAKNKRTWPAIKLPEKRGEITIADVLRTPSGESRDDMIKKWCKSVWEAYHDNHAIVKQLLQTYLPNI